MSSWNQRDAQTVVSFDKIFLPTTIGASVLSLAKGDSSFLYVYMGSWLLLTFWVFLSWRYRARIAERFCIMKQIECCLDFKAHRLICSKRLIAPGDETLRFCFYVLAVFLGGAIVAIHPCVGMKFGAMFDCSPWFVMVMPLSGIVLLFICFPIHWWRNRKN